MNRPASKEPSMDEILSSIRQIIADDEPQKEQDTTASSQNDEAAARGELSAALDDATVEGEPTTIEVEDGPHPDIEAAPIEKRDVAAEALAEARPSQIEPDGDAEEPLALSIDQMLKPSNSNSEPNPEDEELIADPGEVVPTPESDLDASEGGLDMAALLLQETAGQSESGNAEIDDDAKSIEASVPDDVAQVVPDDIAFINDDDLEEPGPAEEDNALAGMGIDDLPSQDDDNSIMARAPEEPKQESPLPDKGLSDDIADSLLEPTAQAASSHAFSQLDNLIMSQKQGQTIEDLIREMLRPMLKAWLDENLPGVVEQLVQREIERVSRGKR